MYKKLKHWTAILLLVNCFTTPVIIVMLCEWFLLHSKILKYLSFKKLCENLSRLDNIYIFQQKHTVTQKTEMKTCQYNPEYTPPFQVAVKTAQGNHQATDVILT